MKNNPDITHTLIERGNKLVEMHIQKIVKSLGGTGYVSVPKELIGKYVTIIFKEVLDGDSASKRKRRKR